MAHAPRGSDTPVGETKAELQTDSEHADPEALDTPTQPPPLVVSLTGLRFDALAPAVLLAILVLTLIRVTKAILALFARFPAQILAPRPDGQALSGWRTAEGERPGRLPLRRCMPGSDRRARSTA